jgi:hypothetical protein
VRSVLVLYVSSLQRESSLVGQCFRGVVWMELTLGFVHVRSLVLAVNLLVLAMQLIAYIMPGQHASVGHLNTFQYYSITNIM